MSPGKIKKLKTLASDIKLKKDTITVFQNTLTSQLQQLNKINKEIAKEGKTGDEDESHLDEEPHANDGDVDFALFGTDSENEDDGQS